MNSAISVPMKSGLMMIHNLTQSQLLNYSLMMDIRLPAYSDNQAYTALYQNDFTNKKDGSLFVKNWQLGLNIAGLGYNGHLLPATWHRVVFSVNEGFASVYLDGELVGRSTTTMLEHWQMGEGALFFLDNDSEEHYIETAEIRFWDTPLTTSQAAQLGAVQ